MNRADEAQLEQFEDALVDALVAEEYRLIAELFNVRQMLDKKRRERHERHYGNRQKG